MDKSNVLLDKGYGVPCHREFVFFCRAKQRSKDKKYCIYEAMPLTNHLNDIRYYPNLGSVQIVKFTRDAYTNDIDYSGVAYVTKNAPVATFC